MPDLRRLLLAAALVPAVVTVPASASVPPPAAPAPVAADLQGDTAVVRWRNVDDAHVVRVVVRRADGVTAPASPTDGTPVFDGAPVADGDLQVLLDPVSVGATYTYGFWSFDAAGNVSAEVTHSILATASPLVHAPTLASDVGTVSQFALSWGSADNPAGTPYDLKYATRGADGTLSDWVLWHEDDPSTTAIFGSAGAPVVTHAGATYRFEALSQDPYGNDTRHGLATVVEPWDTRVAQASPGWRTLRSARRWGGTLAVATRAGARMTWTVTGSEITVVADRCPGCGKLLVTVDGRTRLVADTHAAALAVRQRVAVVGHLPLGRHVVSVRVVGTKGHPAVQLDGLAALD